MRGKDEVLKEALGDSGSKYTSLCTNGRYEQKIFAPRSHFHGEIMNDGYIFNPYIHRRWLPSQYELLSLRNAYFKETFKETFLRNADAQYISTIVVNEVNKMIVLSKYDRGAYAERRHFFTVDVCKEVLSQFLRKAGESLVENNMAQTGYRFSSSKISIHNGIVTLIEEEDLEKSQLIDTYTISTVYKITPLMQAIDNVLDKIEHARSYYTIQKALNEVRYERFDFKKLNIDDVPEVFYESFFSAGAFYSLKNQILFTEKKIDGKTGKEAYEHIIKMVEDGATWEELHALYLQVKGAWLWQE